MKRILVTGAGGYIGSVATYLLLQNGYRVVAVDNYSTGYRKPLELLQEKFGKDKLIVCEADLTEDIEPAFAEASAGRKNIDAVLHYAASCLVDESMKNPEKYFFNNVCGSQNLLTVLLKYKVKHIIFSSTCAVYGEEKYVPMDEKHPIHPTTPYGASKRMVEELIEWYGKLNDLHYVILRYFNVCGASDDGLIGDSKKPSTLLVQNCVRGALGIEQFYLTCPEVDTLDKTPIRDYINVVDLNEAHLLALEYLFNGGKNEIINLGTGTGNSVLEVARAVQNITGKEMHLAKGKSREGDDPRKIASIEKAKQILNWEPKRTMKESVTSLSKWYNLHPHGWDR